MTEAKTIKIDFNEDEVYTVFPRVAEGRSSEYEVRSVDLKEWKQYVRAKNRWEKLRKALVNKYT